LCAQVARWTACRLAMTNPGPRKLRRCDVDPGCASSAMAHMHSSQDAAWIGSPLLMVGVSTACRACDSSVGNQIVCRQLPLLRRSASLISTTGKIDVYCAAAGMASTSSDRGNYGIRDTGGVP
jgi:hypothetical protein